MRQPMNPRSITTLGIVAILMGAVALFLAKTPTVEAGQKSRLGILEDKPQRASESYGQQGLVPDSQDASRQLAELGFQVEVVEQKTNSLAVGAEVLWFSPSSGEAERLFNSLYKLSKVPQEFLDQAQAFAVDGKAKATVPGTAEPLLLMARKDDRLGFLYLAHGLSEGRQRVQVQIAEPQTLWARVIEANGEPAKHPRLRLTENDGEEDEQAFEVKPDGSGLFPIHFANVALRHDPDSKYFWETLQLQGFVANAKTKKQLLARQGIPTKPVQLTVSRGTTVVVTTVDSLGEPITSSDGANSISVFLKNMATDARQIQAVSSGRAVFHGIPVGSILKVGLAETEDPKWTCTETLVTVTPIENNRVDVSLPLRFEGLAVVGRLVYGADLPVTNQTFDAFYLSSKNFNSPHARALGSIDTDDHGNFLIRLPEKILREATLESGEIRIEFRKSSQGGREPKGLTRNFAKALRRRQASDGNRIDVGNVTMLNPLPLVAGFVTDEAGQPLEGVSIKVTPLIGKTALSRELLEIKSSALKATSDKSGHYGVWFTCESHPMQIEVKLDGYVVETREAVCPMDSNLNITLYQSGELRGSLAPRSKKVDGWVATLKLIEPAREGQAMYDQVDFVAGENGYQQRLNEIDLRPGAQEFEFAWKGLPPGTYRVSFVNSTRPEEPLVVDNLVVKSGAPAEDPRLMGVRLADHLKLVHVQVHDQDGSPVALDSIVYLRVGEGAGQLGLGSGYGPSHYFLPPKLPLNLTVTGSDGRADLVITDYEATATLSPE
jgi:hypothetical protein